MGCYNPAPEKLRQAVLSIIAQSFKNWELIICDDGSDAEHSRSICSAAKLDERIIYIKNQKNCGLAYALNRCIKHSCGEYIARMDDDDVSEPDRLKIQYRFMKNNPQYDWAGSNALLSDCGKIWGIRTVPEHPDKNDFLFNSPFIHPTVMFKKEILIKNGGYSTEEKFSQCEDYELFMRLYANKGRGYNIQKALLQYSENTESYKKRTYMRRIREARTRYAGFKQLGILNPGSFLFVLKPLAAGLVPAGVCQYIKRKGAKKWNGNIY